MEWVQIVSEYGALGVLVILMILFARGQVVSKKTMETITANHKASTKELQESFESTVKLLCDANEKQIKLITSAFVKQVASLKAVIQIMKNGQK